MSNRIFQRCAAAFSHSGKLAVLVPGIVVGALYGPSAPQDTTTNPVELQTAAPSSIDRRPQRDPVIDERPFEAVSLATPQTALA